MPDIPHSPFSIIKGRYLAIIWIFPFSYFLSFLGIFETLLQKWPMYWLQIFYSYYFHILFIITIFILAFYSKLDWKIFFKNRVTSKELIPGLKLTLFLFLFSTTTAYIIFYPLSYIFPGFVEIWYIQAYETIYSDGQSYPIIANTLSFLSIVLIAPVFEEIAFRGILLHRWAQKWNVTKAIIFSSILFGIVHPEPISAVVFGAGMCVLYLKTHSLLIPILCHTLNNFVVWLVEVGYRVAHGPKYQYALEDFQNEWYLGVICMMLTIVWICIYLRNPLDLKKYSLPAV